MKREELIERYKKEMQRLGVEMSIMLVEDDLTLQAQMKKVLLHFFSRIDTADNGVEALKLYERRKYDIIITDLTMPFMNGIEVAREIKERDKTQSVFVVSAHNESEKLIELINIGVDGFVLKPLNIAHLLELLKKKSQALYDEKMKKHYSKLLDITHEELKERNRVLEETLRAFAEFQEEKEMEHEKVVSMQEFLALEIEDTPLINEELHVLEESFNFLLLSFHEYKNEERLIEVSKIFEGYSAVLERLGSFHLFAQQLNLLCEIFGKTQDKERVITTMMVHITELFDQLELFRKEVFEYKSKRNLSLLVSKMLRQISQMQSLLEILNNEIATQTQQ
jgi:YesN/AraC family two-component response regulator